MIDSWTWIEYWRGGRGADEAAEHIEGGEEALVSTINLVEIYYWGLRFYDKAFADERLQTVTERCQVIPVETEIAVEAAKIKKDLKLALADSIILATARREGAGVLTGDDDFKDLKDAIFIH